MDIRPVHSNESSSVVAITIQDVGVGMSETQVDVSVASDGKAINGSSLFLGTIPSIRRGRRR